MKKIAVIFFLTFSIVAKGQSYLLTRAKSIANEYYASYQRLAELSNPYDEEGTQLEGKIMNLVGSDSNDHELLYGLRVSNDIDPILGSANIGKSDLTLSSYVGHYRDYAARLRFVFSYKVISCERLESPSAVGAKGTSQFVKLVVRKTYKTSTIYTDVEETMIVTFWDNQTYISSISNMFGTLKTADDLFAVALSFYDQRQYDEAFKWYQKVLEKKPWHTEASYSLGMMCFKGEGCKRYPKKVRDYLVDFYWQKSQKGLNELKRLQITRNARDISYNGYEVDPFPCNRLKAYNWKTKKSGYITAQGNMIIDQKYERAFPFFTNGTAIVYSKEKDRRWFLIDTVGDVKDVFDKAVSKRWDRQILVSKEDKIGVFNRETGESMFFPVNHYDELDWMKGVELGKDKITILYDLYADEESFYDKLLEKYEKGSKIPIKELKKIGELAFPFIANGTVLVSDEDNWLLKDTTGKVLDVFDNVDRLQDGHFLLIEREGKKGCVNRATGEIVPPAYQSVDYFSTPDLRVVRAQKDGEYGLLWPDNTILLPFKYNSVWLVRYGKTQMTVLCDYDKTAFHQLKKKYEDAANIPDAVLKKIGTLLTIPMNKAL